MMGVYEDMANDAGCAYGSNENAMMAASIQERQQIQATEAAQERQLENDMMELAVLEDQCNKLRGKLGIKFPSTLNGEKVIAVVAGWLSQTDKANSPWMEVAQSGVMSLDIWNKPDLETNEDGNIGPTIDTPITVIITERGEPEEE